MLHHDDWFFKNASKKVSAFQLIPKSDQGVVITHFVICPPVYDVVNGQNCRVGISFTLSQLKTCYLKKKHALQLQ